MRLYHFCDEAAYEALQQQGYLNGDGRRADRFIRDMEWRPYQWMAEQMEKRLLPKPTNAGKFPVWAWHTHDSKPLADLRKREFGYKGKRTVRLTLEVPSEQVLLSDEEDWHCVLNNGFITDSEEEYDLWDEREKVWPKEEYLNAMRESWQKIFELNRPPVPSWHHGPSRYVQACFWILEKHMVRKERWFVPR